jgi:hypothetical protein
MSEHVTPSSQVLFNFELLEFLGSRFKSHPGDQLSRLRFLWFSSVPPGK